MAARAEDVREKLAFLEDCVRRVRSLLPSEIVAFEADRDLQWTVERGTQLAAECVLDVGNHILAGEFGAQAAEYGQILPRLAAGNVISAGLAQQGGGGQDGLRILLLARLSPSSLMPSCSRNDERPDPIARNEPY